MKTRYFKYVYILLIVLILFIVGSYAFFSWGSNANSNTNVSFDVVAETVYIEYDAGSDITGANLYPVDDKSDGISKTITVKTDKVVQSKPVTFNLYLDLTSVPTALLHSSFKWAVYTGNNLVSSGNLTDSTVSCNKNSAVNHIVLFSNEKVTTTEKKYVLYLWIDGTVNNPDDMMNKSFEFNLHADGNNALLKSATNILTKKYENGNKTSITTAGGEEITQVVSEGLMQDSFGNIRYYGANPNNYVTFNGESAGWRIIGIFDTEDENGNVSKRVKLIRATSIGSYSYDNKPSGTGTSTSNNGSNDWADARLMMLLNPGYENTSSLYAYEGSLYWNRKSGTCYAGASEGTTSCNFTSTGLIPATHTQIDKVKYYLGRNVESQGLYADDYYNLERGTNIYSGHHTYWIGYVGLIYPSDYAYATNLSICDKAGSNYADDTTNCTEKDWLLDNEHWAWTLSPCSSGDYGASCINTSKNFINNDSAFNIHGVRPVLYLKSEIEIKSGTGKQSDPYILG